MVSQWHRMLRWFVSQMHQRRSASQRQESRMVSQRYQMLRWIVLQEAGGQV